MDYKPLSGVKIVELSTFVAAPCAARILCDMGAEVIKIEGFNGDAWRVVGMNMIKHGPAENPVYDVYNAGKKSICINIKQEKGLACVLHFLETADVFITNIRPKSLRKLGLDPDSLMKRFPRLIFGSISGYGEIGPSANDPGFDNVAFWTRSGFLLDMAIDTEKSYPVNGPTGCGDQITGNALASGILAALFNRERTGKGEVVTTSLYATAIWNMSSMIIAAQDKYKEPYPKKRSNVNPVTTQYRCADGEWFSITILEYDRYAPVVYKLLGITEQIAAIGVTDYYTMKEHSDQVIPLMEASFLKKNRDEWVDIFRKADIVSGPMPHFNDVTKDEQAWVNGYLEEYHFKSGESCAMPVPPVQFASYKRPKSDVTPMPGDNTDEILLAEGYSPEDIKVLRECGAVK